MKFLKVKSKDRGVTYVNADEIVLATVFSGHVHIETRTPGAGGDVGIDIESPGDPQDALDEMMSGAAPFASADAALAEFRKFCSSFDACRGCPYGKLPGPCAIHWMFDRVKEAGR